MSWALYRNGKYLEIKCEPMPVRLDNEYAEEAEVIELTTTNLRNEAWQITTGNETDTSNKRNLDNMGRHVINESTTTTSKYGKKLNNIGRYAITTKTITTIGKYGKGNLIILLKFWIFFIFMW